MGSAIEAIWMWLRAMDAVSVVAGPMETPSIDLSDLYRGNGGSAMRPSIQWAENG